MRNLKLSVLLAVLPFLTSCGVFWDTEEDIDIIAVSKQVLEKQLDENGEPRKIDLPIRVNYSIKRKPLVNEELEIEFEFIAESKIPKVRIAFETTDGLQLVTSYTHLYKDNMEALEIFRHEIIVVPEYEDNFYVHVYVLTEDTEEQKAALVKIPLSLGQYSIEVKQ